MRQFLYEMKVKTTQAKTVILHINKVLDKGIGKLNYVQMSKILSMARKSYKEINVNNEQGQVDAYELKEIIILINDNLKAMDARLSVKRDSSATLAYDLKATVLQPQNDTPRMAIPIRRSAKRWGELFFDYIIESLTHLFNSIKRIKL